MNVPWIQYFYNFENIEFLWPMVWLLLPLPWLARRYLKAIAATEARKLRLPMTQDVSAQFSGASTINHRTWPGLVVLSILWLLLLFALSRPQLVGDQQNFQRNARDIMLSIDISASMLEEDFYFQGRPISRLSAVQAIGSDFIQQRTKDRIGLILFGQIAYLQAPLTFDRNSVTNLLNDAFARMAGNATAIGDSIGLAVKALKDQPKNARVLILLTDGENTAGAISVDKAIELAQAIDLKIYTIGVGSDGQAQSQQMRDLQSLMGMFRQLPRVNQGPTIDEDTMIKIAGETGGQYYRAKNIEELNQIYQKIDDLEPSVDETQNYRPIKDIFYVPLTLAALIFLTYLLGLSSWYHRQNNHKIDDQLQMSGLKPKGQSV